VRLLPAREFPLDERRTRAFRNRCASASTIDRAAARCTRT
jgi:hypothetical protein